jgi:hypothetical protein
MQIQISIEQSEPLVGTAAAGTGAPVRFVGWLELLRAISDLVSADVVLCDSAPAAPAHQTATQQGGVPLP